MPALQLFKKTLRVPPPPPRPPSPYFSVGCVYPLEPRVSLSSESLKRVTSAVWGGWS